MDFTGILNQYGPPGLTLITSLYIIMVLGGAIRSTITTNTNSLSTAMGMIGDSNVTIKAKDKLIDDLREREMKSVDTIASLRQRISALEDQLSVSAFSEGTLERQLKTRTDQLAQRTREYQDVCLELDNVKIALNKRNGEFEAQEREYSDRVTRLEIRVAELTKQEGAAS